MGRHIVKYTQNNGVLPAGYDQLEYIEATGQQYISTSLTPFSSLNYEIKMTGKMTILYNYQGLLNTSTHSTSYESWVYGSGGATYRYTGNKTAEIAILANTVYDFVWAGDGINKHSFTIYQNSESLVDSKYVTSTTTISDTLELYKCTATGFIGYIYGTTIKKDGVLLEQLIPARYTTDGIVGMYGITTNTFYPSASPSNFIAGPSVSKVNRGLVLTKTGEIPPEVPEGYTAVQSIKSSGSQYFETTWIPDFTKDFTIEGKVGFVTVNRGMWIANYGGVGESSFSIELNASSYLRFYNGGDICSLLTGVVGELHDAVITYTASTGVVTMSYSSTITTITGTVPTDRRKVNTQTTYFGTDRFGHRYPYGLYGPVKVTQDGVEILNYQPVKRISDDAYGMWDYITNQFYESETTTGFLGNEYKVNIQAHAIKTAEVNN